LVPLVALGVWLGVGALEWHRLSVGYGVRLGQRLSWVLLLLLMLMMLQLEKLVHQLLQMVWQLRRCLLCVRPVGLLWGRGRGGLKGKRGVRVGLLLLMSEVDGLLMMQGKG